MTDTNKNGQALRAHTDAAQKSAQSPKGMRESLYGHIKVSVRTMDTVILILSILLIASIAIGVAQGGR